MAKGNNKCASCGQWAGRGHKCPTPQLPSTPTNTATSSVPASSTVKRSEIADRIDRGVAAMPSSEERIEMLAGLRRAAAYQRVEEAGFTHLPSDIDRDDWTGPRLRVHGMTPSELDESLHPGWEVEDVKVFRGGTCMATIRYPADADPGYGAKAQTDHLRAAKYGTYVGTLPKAKIGYGYGETKFRVSPETDINAAGLSGYVNTDYHTIVETFGPPTEYNGDKTTVEWHIEFATPDGPVVATIYDYKTYYTPSGDYDWHIGGHDSAKATELVGKALALQPR